MDYTETDYATMWHELFKAVVALRDAPHQEHFAVRFNDEELAAWKTILALVGTGPTPDQRENQ